MCSYLSNNYNQLLYITVVYILIKIYIYLFTDPKESRRYILPTLYMSIKKKFTRFVTYDS